jgi:hypothetical protein
MMSFLQNLPRLYPRQRPADVPVMDGPFKPNHELDAARVLGAVDHPGNLAIVDDHIVCSSGVSVCKFAEGKLSVLHTLPADVTSLAADASGSLAIGCAGRGVFLKGGAYDGTEIGQLADDPLICPTDIAFDRDSIVVTSGSRAHAPNAWKRDLMERGSSGSVWKIQLAAGKARKLADGLAYPSGVVFDPNGDVIFAEAWRHRLMRIRDGRVECILDDLPGYPGRITKAAKGGYWLAVFAPRSQLIEFILSKRAFRYRMLEEVAEEYWMAPSLASGASFLEPLQGGAVKQLGIVKPWAPTRSYGLIVRLDENCLPISSHHSRAGGEMHGVTSVLEVDDALMFTSWAAGKIGVLDLREEGAAV